MNQDLTQLKSIALQLAEAASKKQKKYEDAEKSWREAYSLFENARRLYMGLSNGEDPCETEDTSTEPILSISSPKARRWSKEDYLPHATEYLLQNGSSHYSDIFSALKIKMGDTISEKGVYKALERLHPKIIRGDRRGYFSLKPAADQITEATIISPPPE